MISEKQRGKGSAGWRTIGGQRIYARSKWEANYARYLQLLVENNYITKWEHEPDEFWFDKIKRGVRSYKPDYKVTRPDGTVGYKEVKGYMDPKSLTKLKRMKKYYPHIDLEVVGKSFFVKQWKLRATVRGWE